MNRQRAVGVRLRRNGPVQWFDPGGFRLDVGDLAIVPTEDGPDAGRVVVAASQLHGGAIPRRLPRVLGIADPSTVDVLPGRVVRAERIREVANELIADRGIAARVERVRLAVDAAEVLLALDHPATLPEDLLAALADRFLARFVLTTDI